MHRWVLINAVRGQVPPSTQRVVLFQMNRLLRCTLWADPRSNCRQVHVNLGAVAESAAELSQSEVVSDYVSSIFMSV